MTMDGKVEPLTRAEIEKVRRNPVSMSERALLATIDQRDRGIADLTLAIYAERREKLRLQEALDHERQWYPFEPDQDVHLCVQESAYGATWHAVFRDQDAALEYADSRVDEDGEQYLDVMPGRVAGLRLWNSVEPVSVKALPDDVVRALRVAATLPCIYGSQQRGETACARVCAPCAARRAAYAGLKAAGIEVAS